MTDNIRIDYSSWENDKKKIAQIYDKDEIQGLNGKEIIDFTAHMINEKQDKTDIMELMGLSVKRTRAGSKDNSQTYSEEFNIARKYYNDNLDYNERHKITEAAYNIGYEKLHTMEQAINKAYEVCQVYQDINVMTRPRRPYYRYYPTYNELITFDLDEIRKMTTEDIKSLNMLRKNVQKAIDEANNRKEPSDVKQVEYDVDEIAKEFLPKEYKNYEEFAKANRGTLEKCKTANFASMTKEEQDVYLIAKNYAKKMLSLTVDEARTARWDTGEQLLNETNKFTDDMWDISNFEYDDITDEGLAEIDSGIMFSSFEEALIKATATGIKNTKNDENKAKKRIIKGHLEIRQPDGKVYNSLGQRIK